MFTDDSPLLLIVDDDADARVAIAEFMAARGVQVQRVDNAAAAVEMLERGVVDVLMVSLGLADWREIFLASHRCARSVSLIACIQPPLRELEAALQLGAVRVLAKPLSLLELADAVGVALATRGGFHGRLLRLTLVDLLQMYHHAAATVRLHVHGPIDGELALVHGDLVHAQCQDLVGPPALARLMAVPHGFIDSTPQTDIQRTLSGAFDHLLLDALRAIDEDGRDAQGAGLDDFDACFQDPSAVATPTYPELVAWVSEHAPAAGLWRVDPDTPSITRLDQPGDAPEHELGGTPGTIGWAFEIAECLEPGWQRVELVSGSIGLSLMRARLELFAFARLITGDVLARRFHAEAARLSSWLAHQMGPM